MLQYAAICTVSINWHQYLLSGVRPLISMAAYLSIIKIEPVYNNTIHLNCWHLEGSLYPLLPWAPTWVYVIQQGWGHSSSPKHLIQVLMIYLLTATSFSHVCSNTFTPVICVLPIHICHWHFTDPRLLFPLWNWYRVLIFGLRILSKD